MGKRLKAFGVACCLSLCTVVASAASGSATYIYDSVGRLRGAIYEDGSVQTYRYDPAGNRIETGASGLSGVSIAATASGTEGSTISIGVTRIGTSSNAITMTVSAQNGTAIAGVNYTAPSASFTLASGQTSGTIPVTTIRDGKYNGALNFSVTISSSSSAIAIMASTAQVTINNNNTLDPPPSFAISGPTAVTEGGSATYTVTKTNASSLSHTVQYATSPGTAILGTDYTPVTGQLSFGPSDTPKTFVVPTFDTQEYALSRTFSAQIATPTNGATISTASKTTSITDTDTAPIFTISNSDPTSVVEGGVLTFVVSKANLTRETHSVTFSAVNGTATSGADFTVETTSPLIFAPMETSKTIIVNTINDANDEGAANETFSISLGSANNGATVGSPSSGAGQIRESRREVPGVPGPISPSYQTTSTASFSVSWSAALGYVTSYELYKQKDGATSQTLLYSGTATSFRETLNNHKSGALVAANRW